MSAAIPRHAVFYAFCHPLVTKRSSQARKDARREDNPAEELYASDPLVCLLTHGGYLYFSATYDIVTINAFSSQSEELHAKARWRPVTHDDQTMGIFDEIAWVNPSEILSDHIYTGHGGFACRMLNADQCTTPDDGGGGGGEAGGRRGSGSGREARKPDDDEEGEEWRRSRVFFPIITDVQEIEDPVSYESLYAPKPYYDEIHIQQLRITAQPSDLPDRFSTITFHKEVSKAVSGIDLVLGVTEKDLSEFREKGIEAINSEFQRALDEGVQEKGRDGVMAQLVTETEMRNVKYVLYEPAQASEVKSNTGQMVTRDKGNEGRTLEGFAAMDAATQSGLTAAEVASLRIYTTSCFRAINDPLRENAIADSKNKRHPLAATTFFIYEGLRKLRRGHDWKNFQTRFLWRGLKDVKVGDKFFQDGGGTETACMSTSKDINVAGKFSQSAHPVIFRIRVSSAMDLGAEISWLSTFPEEKEVLYPPLTYLKFICKQNLKGCSDGYVITVKPRFPG